ncbi:MAG: DNA helicase UvrD [Deltaproteobacteria bacterium]|nr:DNA helicase UvrD [Deltaproteobacteria bacterium]MBM4294098.1 DNA helicase UvrD [Deltaproteobacteria bacterium]
MNLTLISASAGSGKTYRLTGKLAEALQHGVEPEEVLATTFTNKAAVELQERARLSLLAKGEWEKAQRIFDGYVGTVNAVCGRLLKDFAFEAGLSPTLDVLPEGEDQVIYEKAITLVVEKHAPNIDPAAHRCGLENWRHEVKKISDLARTNHIAPEQLKESAAHSWATFQKLLPRPNPKLTAEHLDQALMQAITAALANIPGIRDETKKTQKVIDELQRIRRLQSRNPELPWVEWVRLAKLEPAVKSREIVAQVNQVASQHSRHPRFQADIKGIIFKLFACAAESMQAFADFKIRQGLIDFVDQESLCFELLKNPEVRAFLRERLKLVLVDEFQDTSPIELAIFLRLLRIVGQAVWVGDQKQAIYGFRGTDPLLMDAVIDSLIDPKTLEILPNSYRSRPGLVLFTNAVFSQAFEAVGIPPERVRLHPHRQDTHPALPLNVWWLQAKNTSEEAAAMAAGVDDLLEKARDFPLFDKSANKLRSLRGGDVAILCRTNAKCAAVAAALEDYGISASLPRRGLLAQPECVLALACLRYLVDPQDRLAVAEILHYTEDPADPQKWFRQWLANPKNGPKSSCAIFPKLDSRRKKLIHLTPGEVMELALSAGEVRDRVVGWGSGAKRLANLEALRGLAVTYEDHCLIERGAATPAGLVTFLAIQVEGEELDKQEESHDEHTVQVLTYHRAKGLEWPVVILGDLHTKEKSNPFGVHVSPSESAFEVENPLAGRCIRFWPWPYGSHSKGIGLNDAIENCPEQAWVLRQEKKELTRLLYVGMTRARDYLFLTARENKADSTAWLDGLFDRRGRRIVSLPTETGKKDITAAGKNFLAQVSSFQPLESHSNAKPEQVFMSPGVPQEQTFPPARLAPSQYEDPGIKASIVRSLSLGSRLPLVGKPDMARLGEVLHAFLAADDASYASQDRFKMAQTILANWQTDGIAPETLLLAGDRLWDFIHRNFGKDCPCRREWPVHLRLGQQKLSGRIDLLIETPAGNIIIDHKSFPGPLSRWEAKALDYSPQLYLYRQAMAKATHRAVVATYIHMPVAAVMLELDLSA